MSETRGKKVEITCKCGCGRKRLVREADVKRGWGKYFNKACKAREQEGRTGQHKKYLNRVNETEYLKNYLDMIDNKYTDENGEFDWVDWYNHEEVHPLSSEGLGQE